MTPPRLGVRLVLVSALSLAGLSACSNSDSVAGDRTPTQMFDLAQKALADAAAVDLVLETDNLPRGVNGLVKAAGTATKAPAFDGTINVSFNSLPVNVPVRAVGGKVWAIIPGSKAWSTIDPATYGAPDPTTLIDDTEGFGGLLDHVDGLDHTGDALAGGTKVAIFSGTVSGQVMKTVMPSSDDSSPFTGTFNVDEDGTLRSMTLTGAFYSGEPDLTYTVTFSRYSDTAKPIEAP